MIVTAIEEVDNKKSFVYLDGKKSFILYKGELRKLEISLNKEISDELYCHIMEDILPKRARARALHILERREHTKLQLIEKLRKNGYPEIIIEDAVSYVESYHYIDDKRYAAHYIRCRCGKRSRKKLIMELQQRGVDKTIIDIAYDEVSEELSLDEEEHSLIDKLIEKKFRNTENITKKDLQKLYRYLLSKGFSYDDISQHINLTKLCKRYKIDML